MQQGLRAAKVSNYRRHAVDSASAQTAACLPVDVLPLINAAKAVQPAS